MLTVCPKTNSWNNQIQSVVVRTVLHGILWNSQCHRIGGEDDICVNACCDILGVSSCSLGHNILLVDILLHYSVLLRLSLTI